MDQLPDVLRVKRSGRGSGRGLNKLVNTIVGAGRRRTPGAAEAASGLRRRTGSNVRYKPIGQEINEVTRDVSRSTRRGILGSGVKQIDLTKSALLGGAVGSLAGGTIEAFTGKKGGITLPGSDYIGPGNKIDIDAPKSNADAIAKYHDISYQELLESARRGVISQKEFIYAINHSDKATAEQFDKEWKESGDWHAFIGKHGLNFKSWVESHVGHVYPSYPNSKYLLSDGLEKYSAIRETELVTYERRPTSLCYGTV